MLMFAAGDGNHSLATAKTCWEEIKKELSEEEIKTHDMSRIFHKVKIINLFKIVYLIFKRFNNHFFSVINKYQDVRCLKRCIFSYTLSWRNTFDNCTLRCTNF